MEKIYSKLLLLIYPFKSIKILIQYNLIKYLLFPFLITIILSLFLGWGIYEFLSFIIKSKLNFLLEYSWIKFTLDIFLIVQSILFFVIFYRLIIQVVILFFLEPIKNKLENIFHISSSFNINSTNIKQDIINFIWGAYKYVQFILLYILLFFITLIFGPLQTIILFIFNSYALGNGIYDVFFEKEIPSPVKRQNLLKKKKLEILFLGIGISIILLIPIFGIFLSVICGYISLFVYYHKIKI